MRRWQRRGQRRLRQLTGVGAALPAGPLPKSQTTGGTTVGGPTAVGPTLTVTATGTGARFAIGGREYALWRDEWAALPPVLAEQLAACAATGLAGRHGVATVELVARSGAAPAAERIALAVSAALGTAYRQTAQYQQNTQYQQTAHGPETTDGAQR